MYAANRQVRQFIVKSATTTFVNRLNALIIEDHDFSLDRLCSEESFHGVSLDFSVVRVFVGCAC